MMRRLAALGSLLACTVLGCSDSGSSPAETPNAGLDGGSASQSPILLTGQLHLDPLPPGDMAESGYLAMRDAMTWYVDLARQTGARLSAQSTGNFAEAVVSQGHASDYAEFMPGQQHHLASHMHAYLYDGTPLSWTELPQSQFSDPAQVLEVFNVNLGWINQIFTENGATAADNWLLHGSFVQYSGMDGPILSNDGTAATTYTNSFTACGAGRGMPAAYRGQCFDSFPGGHADPSGPFVLIGEVGGIIGLDQEHGPEGQVYGTVPYQRRDFLLVLLEWREARRTDPDGPPLHFTFMAHPWDLTTMGAMGSDGRPVRDSITELITWLNDNFVGKVDASGQTMAAWGNTADIYQSFVAWEADHPERKQELADAVNSSTRGRLLPGLWTQLDSAYHDTVLSIPDVTAHRFVTRDTGMQWVLLYAEREGVEVPAGGDVPSTRDVMSGDGTVEQQDGATLTVGFSPILVAARNGFVVPDGGVPQDGGVLPDGANPCGDGICDSFEQSRPEVCPRDCADSGP